MDEQKPAPLKIVVLIASLAVASASPAARSAPRAAGPSDSGRSLAVDSGQDDDTDDAALPGQPNGLGGRGEEPGLAPSLAQAYVTVQDEHRRLEMPLLECRGRFATALRLIGPGPQHAASAAVYAAREVLDRARQAALADLPEDLGPDPELETIRVSLVAGQRYPATDVLDARWKRLIRQSWLPLDAAVLDARQHFRGVGQSMWRVADGVLHKLAQAEESGENNGARATLDRFRTCLRHRLVSHRV